MIPRMIMAFFDLAHVSLFYCGPCAPQGQLFRECAHAPGVVGEQVNKSETRRTTASQTRTILISLAFVISAQGLSGSDFVLGGWRAHHPAAHGVSYAAAMALYSQWGGCGTRSGGCAQR